MANEAKYILGKSIFYRLYENSTIVYDTESKKVFLFNSIVKDILDCFNDYCDINLCVKNLKKKYIDDEETLCESIEKFVEILAEKGILSKQNILMERKSDLESYYKTQILSENQLCSVQLETTFRCNEKCQHCYCVIEQDRKELSTEEIKSLLDDLSAMNVFDITFTGGDLFVRKDMFDILEYAYEKKFLINIFTNGIALDDSDIIHLKALHPRSIHFSIYSHIAERHDAFTQVKGSFEKTVSVIKKCVTIGIPVNIKTCLLNYNFEDVEGILELAESLGTTIQVSFAVTPKNDGDMSPTAFRLNSPENYAEIMKKVNKHIQIHCSTDLQQVREDNGRVCGAGSHSVNINPYGDVFPCNSLLLKCGNIREQNIKEIWEHSDMLSKVREFTFDKIKGCENCPSLTYCNFCPGSALTETGSPLQKYSEACMLTEAKYILNKEVN